MWIWPSNLIDLVFRKLSISQFPPTGVSLSLSLPVLLFTTAASCGGQVAALSCCEETTTGKSMKSWAPINLNVGLVVGVLFVLLTYLVLSQQAASSGLSGTESFRTLAISNQRADHETRTAVKFLLVAWYAVAATVAQWIMDKHLTTTNGPAETCKHFRSHHRFQSRVPDDLLRIICSS